MNWRTNADAVYQKEMSGLYCLMKLRSFQVCSLMLEVFYQSVLCSGLLGDSIRDGDTNRRNKLLWILVDPDQQLLLERHLFVLCWWSLYSSCCYCSNRFSSCESMNRGGSTQRPTGDSAPVQMSLDAVLTEE